MTAQRRPRIGLLAAPESSAGVLYGLYDVLISVGPTWPDMTALESSEPLLDVSIVAATAEPFRCFGTIPVKPHIAIEDAGEFDAVVVCDMYTPVHTALRGRFVEEVAWLRRKRDEGALLAERILGAELRVIPARDHLWWSDNPDGFLDRHGLTFKKRPPTRKSSNATM